MSKAPLSIEPFLPDSAVYNIAINERMRRLLQEALNSYINARMGDEDEDSEEAQVQQQYDDQVLDSMANMLDPNGSTGPLSLSPAINSFVL